MLTLADMKACYRPGAIVRLASGGPEMTVEHAEWGDEDPSCMTQVRVRYTDFVGVIRTEWFIPVTLLLVRDAPEVGS